LLDPLAGVFTLPDLEGLQDWQGIGSKGSKGPPRQQASGRQREPGQGQRQDAGSRTGRGRGGRGKPGTARG
jgi:hypothetical protein